MNTTNSQYILCTFEEATHFQPIEKKITEDITIDKIYKLEISKLDGERCIYDDCGIDSASYMWNKGRFLMQI